MQSNEKLKLNLNWEKFELGFNEILSNRTSIQMRNTFWTRRLWEINLIDGFLKNKNHSERGKNWKIWSDFNGIIRLVATTERRKWTRLVENNLQKS